MSASAAASCTMGAEKAAPPAEGRRPITPGSTAMAMRRSLDTFTTASIKRLSTPRFLMMFSSTMMRTRPVTRLIVTISMLEAKMTCACFIGPMR